LRQLCNVAFVWQIDQAAASDSEKGAMKFYTELYAAPRAVAMKRRAQGRPTGATSHVDPGLEALMGGGGR
jgi:hypothetical protein